MIEKPTEEDLDQMRRLYPDIPEDKLAEAWTNLELYIEHTLEQYDRIKDDPVRYAKFQETIAEIRRKRMNDAIDDNQK